MKPDKRLIVILTASIIVVVIIALIILSVGSTADNPADMLSLGERYLLEMEYEQALVQFLAVIEIEPNNVRAYIGAAEAYVGLGQMDSAAGILRQGLEQTESAEIAWAWVELDPDNSRVYLDAAELLVSFGDIENALEILRVGLERTGNEDIARLIEELEPSSVEDESSMRADETVDEETAVYPGGNLTGQPPVTMAEFTELGIGVPLRDMVGQYGITQEIADNFLRGIEYWLNSDNGIQPSPHVFGSANLIADLDSEARIRSVDTSTGYSFGQEQLGRFYLGMSMLEAVQAVAVSNPDIITVAGNPTYENFVEYGEDLDSVIGISDFGIENDDGLTQYLALYVPKPESQGQFGLTAYQMWVGLSSVEIQMNIYFNDEGYVWHILVHDFSAYSTSQ